MNTQSKRAVRSFILEYLNGIDRLALDDLARKLDLHPFEVADCLEGEVQRIRKLFCYPDCDD